MNSELIFTVGLPNIKNKKNCILIYDKILTSKKLTTWIQTFPNKYGVHSGESLKETKNFHQHIQKILKLSVGISKQEITIVALGGGSIGDFSGFVASVLKRGVRLVHVPSTWLSAIDSAHGGKTALNAGGIKNQIGTFYPAQKTYISKKILFTQPEIRLQDAWGEALKTALLSGPGLYKKLLKKPKINC
jgi:3-dehydroquinate synthase